MSVRKTLLAAAAALAVSASFAPAHADEGLGVATQFAGAVFGSSIEGLPLTQRDTPTPSEEVSGWCTFAGATTLNGRIQFAYAGYAAAYSTTTDQPELTVLTCTMISPAQGLSGEMPTQTKSLTIAGPGATSALADTTPAWPLRPVQVCIAGYTTFGPVEPVTRTIVQTCRSTTL